MEILCRRSENGDIVKVFVIPMQSRKQHSPEHLDRDSRMEVREGLESFDLSGKVAVVTGGTGVLGGAIAIGLARVGAKVAIVGRRKQAAEATVAIIQEFGGESFPLPADVLDLSSLQEAKLRLQKRWDSLDILVNCAG